MVPWSPYLKPNCPEEPSALLGAYALSRDYAARANAEREFAFMFLLGSRVTSVSACFTNFKITVETCHPLAIFSYERER
jgi:hypothetical protein